MLMSSKQIFFGLDFYRQIVAIIAFISKITVPRYHGTSRYIVMMFSKSNQVALMKQNREITNLKERVKRKSLMRKQ